MITIKQIPNIYGSAQPPYYSSSLISICDSPNNYNFLQHLVDNGCSIHHHFYDPSGSYVTVVCHNKEQLQTFVNSLPESFSL